MSITNKTPIKKGVAKVPVIMQLEAVECGAASLTMVMAYFGKWVTLEQARIDCGVSRDGSSAKNILKAARNYGFKADGFKCEPEDLMQHGEFPCIIHWNLNHFVVLNGFKGNKAYINDPAMGSYSVSMDEFNESFTGICILLSPSEEFEPSGQKKSMLEFVKKRLKGNGGMLAFVVITTAIMSLLNLLFPAFSRIFLDSILPERNSSWFLPFITGLCVLCGFEIVIAWIQAIYSLKLSGKLDATGNTSYMWKVLNLPINFFNQRMTGDIRILQDSNAEIAGTLVGTLAPLAIDAVMLIFYLVVMLKNSLILTFAGVFSILLNALLSYIISKRRINYTRVQVRDAAKLESTTTAGFELIETLKSSGSEGSYFGKWAGYQASVYEQDYKYNKRSFVLECIPEFISSLADIAVMVIGVYLIINGEFTIGGVMAFQGFLSSFMEPAESFLSASQTIIEMRTDMERIDDVMEYASDDVFATEDIETEEGTSKLAGHIEIKNISFGYSPLKPPLINDFNLEIQPGQQIAIVGSSGCGKSTLSKLISGLYKPWSGEILIDGKHLYEIKKSTFAGSLAVVDQDGVMFEDTIADNIKLWDNTIENFEMILAARDAHIHNDIAQRPDGYQARIAEGGSNFSGGQCQRIEIARVLAQDPSIIIMDEATSALDAQTEYDVVQSIKERGITCIVIAHRLSTIRNCDKIIVLDEGRQIGCGTHEELIKTNEYYKSLIMSN